MSLFPFDSAFISSFSCLFFVEKPQTFFASVLLHQMIFVHLSDFFFNQVAPYLNKNCFVWFILYRVKSVITDI